MSQYLRVIYPSVTPLHNGAMDKYERRRIRVQELIRLRFDSRQARFAEAIGRDANYVSRMLYAPGKAGKKRIAEDMRDAIEQACHLTPGWLDMDPGTPIIADGAAVASEPQASYSSSPDWPFDRVTPAQWATLTAADRAAVEAVIAAIVRHSTAPARRSPTGTPQAA